MIMIPSTVRTAREVDLFFDGIAAGIVMCDEGKGQKVSFKKEPVTAADLLHDLEIFRRQGKELLAPEPTGRSRGRGPEAVLAQLEREGTAPLTIEVAETISDLIVELREAREELARAQEAIALYQEAGQSTESGFVSAVLADAQAAKAQQGKEP